MGPQGTAGCPQAAPLHWGQGLPFPVPATPAMTQQIPECSGGSELGREAFTQMPRALLLLDEAKLETTRCWGGRSYKRALVPVTAAPRAPRGGPGARPPHPAL